VGSGENKTGGKLEVAREKPQGFRPAWGEYRQRGLSCSCGGFLDSFATLLKDFALGANPVFQRVPGSAIALEINLVSAQLDLPLRGEFLG
jgi:hypothetical protein